MNRELKRNKKCRARFLKDVREALNYWPFGSPQYNAAARDNASYTNGDMDQKNNIALMYCFPPKKHTATHSSR